MEEEIKTVNDNKAEISEEETPIKLEEELETMKNNWLRALAEMENLKKRLERDREDAKKYGILNFARDIVGIADNIQRALESCATSSNHSDEIKNLIAGIEMVAQGINNTFERHGIKEIPAQNNPFDPNFHEAMFDVEAPTEKPGTIIRVLQKGYTLHDRLLRPSMVGVAKAPQTPSKAEETENKTEAL